MVVEVGWYNMFRLGKSNLNKSQLPTYVVCRVKSLSDTLDEMEAAQLLGKLYAFGVSRPRVLAAL